MPAGEKRAGTLSLVQQENTKLIDTIINFFSHQIVKRGDLRCLAITLEPVRHRQRVAYFSNNIPVLRAENRDRRDCMAKRD